jgi:hypothetical protein
LVHKFQMPRNRNQTSRNHGRQYSHTTKHNYRRVRDQKSQKGQSSRTANLQYIQRHCANVNQRVPDQQRVSQYMSTSKGKVNYDWEKWCAEGLANARKRHLSWVNKWWNSISYVSGDRWRLLVKMIENGMVDKYRRLFQTLIVKLHEDDRTQVALMAIQLDDVDAWRMCFPENFGSIQRRSVFPDVADITYGDTTSIYIPSLFPSFDLSYDVFVFKDGGEADPGYSVQSQLTIDRVQTKTDESAWDHPLFRLEFIDMLSRCRDVFHHILRFNYSNFRYEYWDKILTRLTSEEQIRLLRPSFERYQFWCPADRLETSIVTCCISWLKQTSRRDIQWNNLLTNTLGRELLMDEQPNMDACYEIVSWITENWTTIEGHAGSLTDCLRGLRDEACKHERIREWNLYLGRRPEPIYFYRNLASLTWLTWSRGNFHVSGILASFCPTSYLNATIDMMSVWNKVYVQLLRRHCMWTPDQLQRIHEYNILQATLIDSIVDMLPSVLVDIIVSY